MLRDTSQRQIRCDLGTGSNITLSAYRRKIAEQRVEEVVASEPDSLDAKLLATVTQLVSQFASEAAQVADDRTDEIEDEAQRRIQIAETTMEKRLEDTDLLEHRATMAEAMLAESRQMLERRTLEFSTLTQEHHAIMLVQAKDRQALVDVQRQLDERTQVIQGLRSESEALHLAISDSTQRLSKSAAIPGEFDNLLKSGR